MYLSLRQDAAHILLHQHLAADGVAAPAGQPDAHVSDDAFGEGGRGGPLQKMREALPALQRRRSALCGRQPVRAGAPPPAHLAAWRVEHSAWLAQQQQQPPALPPLADGAAAVTYPGTNGLRPVASAATTKAAAGSPAQLANSHVATAAAAPAAPSSQTGHAALTPGCSTASLSSEVLQQAGSSLHLQPPSAADCNAKLATAGANGASAAPGSAVTV